MKIHSYPVNKLFKCALHLPSFLPSLLLSLSRMLSFTFFLNHARASHLKRLPRRLERLCLCHIKYRKRLALAAAQPREITHTNLRLELNLACRVRAMPRPVVRIVRLKHISRSVD